MVSCFWITSCRKRRNMMAKLSQKKQFHEDAVLVNGCITSFIMNSMVESMVRANIPDKSILDTIAQTKKRVQLLEKSSCDDLTKEMVNQSTLRFDYYGQDWLNECRDEIKQEKKVA